MANKRPDLPENKNLAATPDQKMRADFGQAEASELNRFHLQQVGRYLDAHGMSRWRESIMAWMHQYAGFEDNMLHEDFPAFQVHACLRRGAYDSDLALAETLARCEFLTWRVKHPGSKVLWHPLKLAFSQFSPDQPPTIYQLNSLYPPPSETVEYLLQRLEPDGSA